MCREVCSSIVRARPPVVGTHLDFIQIDEARFARNHKYHRGRILRGDHPAESGDSEAEVENQQNHGGRIDSKQGTDCRYFWVERRNRNTLKKLKYIKLIK